MGKVIEGVYVFEKTALFQVSYAAGITAWIHFMSYPVGFTVELIVIKAFVNPDAPKDYAGMISVFPDHFLEVYDLLLLPLLISKMLPAGELGEYKESHAVAGFYEIVALRIV